MKPEVSERLLIESLFNSSVEKLGTSSTNLQNIERLTGDASTRRYYRLFTDKYSFVVCLDNPSATEKNSFIDVQNFLIKHGIRVPKIHDMNLYKGYILEEDLGDVTLLQNLSQIADLDEEFRVYKNIIDSLLEIHRISADIIKQEEVLSLKFDNEKLMDEIQFTLKYFLEKFLNITDTEIHNQVFESFKPICLNLAKQKMVFTHRDFHSRNIMVLDDEYIIIDFQDARWGIPQYDLVSMLEDCYYDIDKKNKQKLIKYYYENLASDLHGQGDFENFMSLYNDMAIQRVFKAIGSFSYIYETRKDVRYIKYIGFAMEKLKIIFFEDEKYSTLRQILFKYYYES